jgi:ferredoxin
MQDGRKEDMKCIIIYFSQTGNTEKIALSIQSGIKKAAGHCDIQEIKNTNPRRLYEYDLIGLGSSVFGGQLGCLGVFLNDLRFVGGKHAFLFCTHGTTPESFYPAAYERMKRRGLTVIGIGDWYGDCNLLHMPQPYPTAGHPDMIDLQEADTFGQEMVERSRKITAGALDLIPPPPPPGPPPPPVKDNSTLHFSSLLKYHKDKCLYPECRLCMENCPMYGIDLSVDPPVLAKPCLSCEFCARLCPTGALDMNEWLETMVTMGSKFLPNALKHFMTEAGADGRFRRLIPLEDLKFDTYGYMLHKKHPQWVIGKGQQ